MARSMSGQERPHSDFPLSSSPPPLQQPLCSTPLHSGEERMQSQQGLEREMLVACCVVGSGAAGSSVGSKCQ
eukprot:1154270-Pelagomonas_calceolata.AAC.2